MKVGEYLKLAVKLKDLLCYPNMGIGVEATYAREIKSILRSRFGSQKAAARYMGINEHTIADLEKRCKRFYILNKISQSLDISLDDLEPRVNRVCDHFIYHIRFPYKVSPLLIRLIAHLLGDGTYADGGARWIQKDAGPIVVLQNALLNISGSILEYEKVEQCPILALYVKLACAALKIGREKVVTADFLKACLNLPRPYKVQVITAIVEDEGFIRPRSCSIRIAMKDLEIVKALGELMDSLGYDRSEVKKILVNGSFGRSMLYALYFHILGAHRFFEDLEKAIKAYGPLAGLWKKQLLLQEMVRRYNGKKARGRKINQELSSLVMRHTRNKEVVSYKEIKKRLDAPHQRVRSVVRRMLREGSLKRKQRGLYRVSIPKSFERTIRD